MTAQPARVALRFRVRGTVALICLLAASAACAPRQSPRQPGVGAADAAWVEETLAGMSLRRKAAQLLFPRIPGGFLSVEGDAFERMRGWVEDEGVGGVIATIGPPLEAAATFNALQRLADVPLLITADMEHGPGQLLNAGTVLPYGFDNGSATRFPPAMAVAATGDERFAYELGRITALEARAVGVHMTFAPVVDVNNNPDNPIINTRSYGADAGRVARFAAAHIRGLQEHGLLATAKHFPGHGDTGTDSHIELPVITVDAARVDSVELAPYRAAIDAGVSAVMSAHIAFPGLTGDSVPATLSPAVMTGLLRERLGFDGLVTTDALDMGAIVSGWGASRAPVLAVRAGADMLLQVDPEDVGPAIDALVDAVDRGELTEARLDTSVRRILSAKAGLGLQHDRLVDLEALPELLATDEHRRIAQEAADRSITLVRDLEHLLPFPPGNTLAVLVTFDPDPWAGRTFQRTLAESDPAIRTVTVPADAAPVLLDSVRTLAAKADRIVIAPFIRVGAYAGSLAVPEPAATLIGELIRLRPSALVSFGNPYLLQQFPEAGTYLLAWGQWEAPQRAAARAITGAIPISGRLPIDLPPDYRVGDGITLDPGVAGQAPSPLDIPIVAPPPTALPEEVGFDASLPKEVEQKIRSGLVEGAAPGAAVAIGRAGRLVVIRGEGRLERTDGWPAVTDSTIFDVASLTKAVATTTALMILVDEGRVDLDAPVSRYLPEFAGDGRAEVTVRTLLTHSSGLPGWVPLYRKLRGRRPYLLAISAIPLGFEPGTSTEYSDLGAILLGLIVERVSGRTLDVFAHERIFRPLGMRDTGFNPLGWTEAGSAARPPIEGVLGRLAPTEVDTVFRHRELRGEVHDENAWAMGGVAGHAGLFSSARDLARFAQMMLSGGRYEHVRIVSQATVREFTRRQSALSSRALGWDTPGTGSPTAESFSQEAFGHTGFTGTSLWIDPKHDLFVVLLTNRVNPTRDNPRIGSLRRAVHGAVRNALGDEPPPAPSGIR